MGAAVVRAFAREGADVAFTHFGPRGDPRSVVADVEKLGRRALALEADAADFAGARRVVQGVARKLGRLDLVVCNAGINLDRTILKMTETEFDRVIAVNLKGTFNYLRAAGLHFQGAKGGAIVTVASVNALRGKIGQANYAAAKAGVVSLTRTAALEFARLGVRVNCLAPGLTDTPMTADMPAQARARSLASIPLGRAARPEEVAQAVLFLASPRASMITGEVLRVDGGQLL